MESCEALFFDLKQRRAFVRLIALTLFVLFTLGVTATQASAHCQVPCGIYDDAARIQAMREDASTIRKAVVKTNELSKDTKRNINQITRWVTTKEEHATRIIKTVSEYFLTQKLKPVDSKDPKYAAYLQRLADHHQVMRWAMKNKQQLELKTVAQLDNAIDVIAKHWAVKKKRCKH